MWYGWWWSVFTWLLLQSPLEYELDAENYMNILHILWDNANLIEVLQYSGKRMQFRTIPPIWLIDFGSTGCSIDDFDWSFPTVCLTDESFSIPLLDVANEELPPIKDDEDVEDELLTTLPPPPPLLLLLLLLLLNNGLDWESALLSFRRNLARLFWNHTYFRDIEV